MDVETSSVLVGECESVRYIAVKGVREIARSNDLKGIMEAVFKMENNTNVGTSDVVIWDLGTPEFPIMSVVASTCCGWIPVKTKRKKNLSENFGISFTPKEIRVLRQFFEVWNLEGGLSVSEAIKNIYEQTYVKNFKPGPDQIRLDRDEFKVFVSKLLNIVNSDKATLE